MKSAAEITRAFVNWYALLDKTNARVGYLRSLTAVTHWQLYGGLRPGMGRCQGVVDSVSWVPDPVSCPRGAGALGSVRHVDERLSWVGSRDASRERYEF